MNITERGVVWSTNPDPTTSDFKLTDGAGGTGTYVSNLSGLTNGVTYYIRAYAINNGTTVYANELSFKTGTPHVIGESLAGGKVIYVDCSGQHGLIGALVDQSTSAPWGCYGTYVGTGYAQGGNVIYAGLANTNLIVAACGVGTAAQLCAAYTTGGTNLPGITIGTFLQRMSSKNSGTKNQLSDYLRDVPLTDATIGLRPNTARPSLIASRRISYLQL